MSNKEFRFSPIQEQFLLASKLNPQSKANNLASLFKLKGSLNISVLERSLDMIRYRYTWAEQTTLAIHSTAFSSVGVKQVINSPFDLDRGGLFRCHLWKGKEEEAYLLFVFHHIIFDLKSKDIFSGEFNEIFNAHAEGRDPILAPPIPYERYIHWFDEFSRSDRYRKMISYWKKEPLEYSVLELPADYERQPGHSSRGERLYGVLPKAVSDRLQIYCRKRDSDPFLVLLSAYAVLLYRYSGQNNISIGIPRTNRPEGVFQEIIGCFVNILPLCLSIEDGMDFQDLLRLVRLKMLGMHRNQYVPYLEVVKLNRGKRDGKYNPLFQAGFTFEHPMALELNSLETQSLDAAPNAAQLDLFFYFWHDGDDYRWAIEYCSDLFSLQRVQSFFSSFLEILQNVMDNDKQSLDTISLLDRQAYEKIRDWNSTDREYRISGSIIDFFMDRAERASEKTALVFRGESLSYGDLARKVRILAEFLKEKGVGPETIVGLSLERSFEMVIGMYAIVLAGGTYLPIEPTLPEDYISYIREDSRLSLVLSFEAHRSLFPGLDGFIPLDSFDFTTRASGLSLPPVDADTRIYILYTSGSTGRPKGVEITHRGLINRILWMDEQYGLTEGDVLFQKTPYNFDVSGWEFWWPLLKGVPLVIAKPEGHRDNIYLLKTIQEEGITIIHFVPSMLREFLNVCKHGDCPLLRDVMCSGDALPAAVVREFYERLPHARLHNLYGPTEASIDVTYWSCVPDCRVVPIGKPVSNTKIHILDRALNPLPPGVTGEIYLAGVQLARGYLNKPELTEERFVSDPFDGGKMYRTGDLGQWTLQGEILYLGRNDSQVQLHGLRIELGEIENTLQDHVGVEAAAVIVQGDFGAEQSLIAFIARRGELMAEDLVDYLSQRLPLYMVPKRIIFVKEIRLNANGKLDRKNLPDPGRYNAQPLNAHELPVGERENFIAQIWMKMLNRDHVGRDENFFELGGSSIHIIQIQRELSEKLGQPVPIMDLFIHTTVKGLAGYIGKLNLQDKDIGKLINRAERSRHVAHRMKDVRKR